MLRCTPHDLTIFDNQWLQLPEHPIPAHDRDLFVEDYLFGWRFDQIRSRLAVLIGNFPTVTGFDGNTVLVLLEHVAEFGWKAEGWDVPADPHWWTILEGGFASQAQQIHVEIAPTPGRRRQSPSQQPKNALELSLSPNAVLGARFVEARVAAGTQRTLEDVPLISFENQTDWTIAYKL